ncbi:MAG: putative quinol monooxygenase [Oryzomonas sp.]|uniref:putative quinol monooxygenase n=1 Tax=Oryzomonas sp. TaxID=2855186 RepID=UPI00284F00A8|nr:putative quinol monooxygenase [Oryzomonas sp.]MDR3580139.1 putative quinol monooxygenase [Oryzomonas sp.]
MSVVTVVAELVVKEDAVETVKAELLKLIEPTRREAGCIEYRLHQDNDDPKVFVFYENWQSMANLERHMASTHFQNYVAAIDGMIEKKGVRKMTCIA